MACFNFPIVSREKPKAPRVEPFYNPAGRDILSEIAVKTWKVYSDGCNACYGAHSVLPSDPEIKFLVVTHFDARV